MSSLLEVAGWVDVCEEREEEDSLSNVNIIDIGQRKLSQNLKILFKSYGGNHNRIWRKHWN